MTQAGGEPPTMPLAVPFDRTRPPPVAAPATPAAASPPMPATVPAAVLIQVGDIAVSPGAVHTPVGMFPLRGSTWQVADHWLAQRYTPSWAIVLSLVLACPTGLLSLLLLLVRDTRYHGMVAITVTSGAYQYTCHAPVTTREQIAVLHQHANYARTLAVVA